MLTAYCRSVITGKLVAYRVEDVSVEDMEVVSSEIKSQLGGDFLGPVLFSIDCGKASLKGQPEPVEVA